MRANVMNKYAFGLLVEPTTPPVVGDAATLETFCKAIGNLIFAPGGCTMEVNGRLGITTGAYVTTNAAAANAAVELFITSRWRLPSSLMPPSMGATSSGTVAYSAGGAIFGVTLALDDKSSNTVSGVDRPIVTKGCGIVAYVPAGVDISDELDAQVIIPVCNGQNLVIGTAIQTAMDGTYPNPFSSAWAHAICGGTGLEQVAVIPTNIANRIR